MDKRSCELIWHYWMISVIGSFLYLELRAYHHPTHKTLSRELQRWTGWSPRRRHGVLAPWVFALGGAWLSWHIRSLQDAPENPPAVLRKLMRP